MDNLTKEILPLVYWDPNDKLSQIQIENKTKNEELLKNSIYLKDQLIQELQQKVATNKEESQTLLNELLQYFELKLLGSISYLIKIF